MESPLTEKKCQFGVEQIEFLGHVFSKDGLKPSPDKVRAVIECGVPENKEAVRSFLGMAGYLDNFIENYAAICLLYTSPSPRDGLLSRMPSSA